eukprot:Clim_evm17s221 gene=Clim_evmTU17s221
MAFKKRRKINRGTRTVREEDDGDDVVLASVAPTVVAEARISVHDGKSDLVPPSTREHTRPEPSGPRTDGLTINALSTFLDLVGRGEDRQGDSEHAVDGDGVDDAHVDQEQETASKGNVPAYHHPLSLSSLVTHDILGPASSGAAAPEARHENVPGQAPTASHGRKSKTVKLLKLDYTPQVTLEYRDRTGKKLTAKEAYKIQGQKWHKAKPGKAKVERQIRRRLAEERTREAATDEAVRRTNLAHEAEAARQAKPYLIIGAGGAATEEDV